MFGKEGGDWDEKKVKGDDLYVVGVMSEFVGGGKWCRKRVESNLLFVVDLVIVIGVLCWCVVCGKYDNGSKLVWWFG